jgi:isoquinoline 1-oxidoreductase beta subunit
MEPPAATAQLTNGKIEVWAPLQSPGGAREDIAKKVGLSEGNVAVHNTLLGGGFGRKSKCDYAIEAALLAKETGGAPVKVVWTREDDIRHGFYHTVTADRFEAGLDANNKVVAWRHRSSAPTFMSNFMPDPKHPLAIELGLGLVDAPFDIPNLRIESGEAEAHTRIGWFRSVNNIAHAFSIQSFVAEIAHELDRDPDRPSADHRVEHTGHHAVLEQRRADRLLSDRHWTPAPCDRARSRTRRLGPADAERKWPGHSSPSQLCELHRYRGGGGGRRQG